MEPDFEVLKFPNWNHLFMFWLIKVIVNNYRTARFRNSLSINWYWHRSVLTILFLCRFFRFSSVGFYDCYTGKLLLKLLLMAFLARSLPVRLWYHLISSILSRSKSAIVTFQLFRQQQETTFMSITYLTFVFLAILLVTYNLRRQYRRWK